MAENILIADDNELPPPANNKIVIADDDDLPPALNEKKKPSPNGGTPLQPGTKATSLSKSTSQSVSVNPKNNPIPLTKSGSISGVPDFSGIVKDAVTPKVNPYNRPLAGIGKPQEFTQLNNKEYLHIPTGKSDAEIKEALATDKMGEQLARYLTTTGKDLTDFDPTDFKKHLNTINGQEEETPFIGKDMAAYHSDLDAYGKASAIINRNIDATKAEIDGKLGPGTFGKYQKMMQDYQSQFKFKEPLIKKMDGDIEAITKQLTDLQAKAKTTKDAAEYGQIKQQYTALYSQAEQLQQQRDAEAGPLTQMQQQLEQFSGTPEFKKLNYLYDAQQKLSEKQESLLDKHPGAKKAIDNGEAVQQWVDKVSKAADASAKSGSGVGSVGLNLFADVLKTITKTSKNLSAIPNIVQKATGTEGVVEHSPLKLIDAAFDAINDVSTVADRGVDNITPSNMQLPVSQHYKIVDGNKIFVDKNGNALFARDIDGYKLGDSAEKKAIEKYNATPEAKSQPTVDKVDAGVLVNEAVKFGLDIVGPLKGIGTGLTELGLVGSAAKRYANGTLTLMGYGLNDAYESAKQSAPNLTDQQASQYALGSQAAIGLMFSMLGGAKMKYITGDGENIFAKIRSAISKEKGLKLDANDIKAIDGGLSPYQVGQRKVLGLIKESLLQGGEMGVIMPTANALMNGVTNKLVGYKALGTDIDLKESFVNGGAPAMLVGAVTGFSGVNRSSIKNEAWSKITKDDATAKATLNFINQSTEDGLYTQEQADRLKQRISYTVKNLEPFAGTLDEPSKKILANLYDHKFQLTEKANSLTDDAAKKAMESQIKDIDNDIAETIKGNQDNLKSQIAVGIRDGLSSMAETENRGKEIPNENSLTKDAEQIKNETGSNATEGQELNNSSGVSESNGNSGDIQQGVGETTMSDQTEIPKVEEESVNSGSMINEENDKHIIKDETNKPLVFYHGTPSEFTEFDMNKLGSNTNAASAMHGIFFSNNKNVSESYRKQAIVDNPNIDGLKSILNEMSESDLAKLGEKIFNNDAKAYYGDLSKEEIIDDILHDINSDQQESFYPDRNKYIEKISTYLKGNDIDFNPYIEKGQLISANLEIKNPKIIDANEELAEDIGLEKILQDAKNEGHDGVIIKNVYDSVSFGRNTTELSDIAVVFDTKSIRNLSDKNKTNEEQSTNADITGQTTDAEPVITTDETSQKSEETKSTEESGEGQREKGEDVGSAGEEKGNVLSGIKKAENDKLRESLGLPKVELPKGVSRVEGMRQAKELVDSGEVNPLDIENKAISFKDEPHKLQASTQDNNVLNYRRHQLVQKKAELLKQKALLESGDMNKPETIQELAVVQQRIIDNLQEIDRNSLASDVVGKVFAGSGNARQVLLNSMGKIERDIERIKATYADEVPEDVKAKLEDLQARADEAHARLSALEEQFDTTKQEFEDEVKRAYERGKNEGTIKPAKTYTEKAKTAADTIRKLKTKPITLRDADGNEITLTQNNILPWNEMVELAASAVEKAGEAADRVSVAIDAAMGRLKDEEWYMNLSPKNRKAIEEQVGQQIEDLLSPTEKAPKLSIPQARIKEAMRMGIDNIKALVEEINKDYPDATPREVRDAITGYGTTKELNKDPENVALRRMKRIGRYISMLEDIENNERPSRSGLQRDVIDPDERKMLKEVREKLKKLKPTDEDISKKLKTAQDIIEARLQNEIDDIQREIDTGERAIKTKRDIPATEKMDELRALKAQKIAERDAKFATDKREDALQEIRDAAAEEDTKTITVSMVKNNLIGDLVSAHITEGEPTESVYDSAFKKVKEILPDVTEREFREAFLKKGKFAPQQKTKTQLQKELADIKSQQSLIKRIDDLNNGIVAETKKQGEKSEAVKKLQKELADIKKKANNQFAELSADELRKKAEAVKRQIDKGEYIKPEVVKNKFESNPEWIKRNRELVNIKMELKKLEADAYEGNKSTFMKICDVFNNWTTRALFLGTYAYQVKLGVAAGMSVFSRPFEELAGGIYNTAFKGISKNAPIEGNTMQSLKSLPDFYKKALPFLNPIETLQSTKEILSTGQSKLDKEFDPFHKENFTFKGKDAKDIFKSFFTADHIPLIDALTTDPHMIMKDPIKRGAYEASYKNYMQWVADNMGPEYVNDPMVIETAKNASYLRAKSEIFMGGKVTEGGSKEAKGWNDKIKAYFTALQMNAIKKAKSESVTERMSANNDYALSTAWNFLVPIKKVPLNILSRVVKGNPIVLAKNILGAIKTNYEVNNKGLQLSTEESDAILRDLKKGTTGSVWWILGYLAAGSMVGGFYNPFDPDKNRKKEVKSGEILLGQEEDSWQNLVIHGGEHSSQIASLMLGATFHSTLRHYMEDEKEAFLYAMTMASVATTRATIDQNPLVGLGFDAADAFKSEHGAKRFGENVKGRFDIPKKVETINPVTYWSEKLHNHGKKKEKSKD